MTFAHVENKLRFVFDDGWSVLKWDEHRAYVDGLQPHQNTKAVDFLGLHLQTTPWFIEVKDPRGHRIEYKPQLADGSLLKAVAEKVRDTIAGLVWAHQRVPFGRAELMPYVRALFQREPAARAFVVLWLEQDRLLRADEASALQDALKRELSWLKPKVLVVNRAIAGEQGPVPGLSVESLPAGDAERRS